MGTGFPPSCSTHDAVDQVRRAEHRALKRASDDRLTGSKYLWLMRPQDMSPAQREAFQALQGQDLKVARACPNLLTYLRHPITNAGLEAVNAVIQWVKKTARDLP